MKLEKIQLLKKELVQSATVYNISLKGDESFVANHIVTHNTKPHIIVPKDAKALSWKSKGSRVYAKKVYHPGTRPQPFIRNTFYHKLPRMIEQSAALHLGEDYEIEVTYDDFNSEL